jgi:hypothetical protein
MALQLIEMKGPAWRRLCVWMTLGHGALDITEADGVLHLEGLRHALAF